MACGWGVTCDTAIQALLVYSAGCFIYIIHFRLLSLGPSIVQTFKDCHISKGYFSHTVVEKADVGRVCIPGPEYQVSELCYVATLDVLTVPRYLMRSVH